jgi:hypothetical protein
MPKVPKVNLNASLVLQLLTGRRPFRHSLLMLKWLIWITIISPIYQKMSYWILVPRSGRGQDYQILPL